VKIKNSELQALLSLLGDKNPKVAATARRKLLGFGPLVIDDIKSQLPGLELRARIRVQQVIAWLETKPRSWELPAFIPRFSYRRVKER